MSEYIEKILKARVYDVAIESPLDPMKRLSKRYENNVLLKREDLQPVFSFKLRGAYNKIYNLTEEEKAKGIIAASAGNHAQGVALAAQKLGLKATIVMPKTTPDIKVASVKSYGASAILRGDSYDEAFEAAQKLIEEKGMTFIHPYDDPDVIAGQGTIGMEILRQFSGEIEAVFIPVGGGGLLAGVTAFIKYLQPQIKIIAVEPDDAPCFYAARKAGKRVELDQVGIFADGVAVRKVGEEPFRITQNLVDDAILVSTDEICAAIKDIFDDTRLIAEPAGALAVAGVKKYIDQNGMKGKTFVAINSGANINFDRLRHVAERAELGEKREMLAVVTIPEKSGSFLSFAKAIGRRSVTEFNYRYNDENDAHIFVGIKLSGEENEKELIIDKLKELDFRVQDLTDNEMAKLHVRYMVGGHAEPENELLYRFEFPERPGALLQFLTKIGKRWNISMFHYRNHGAAYGRVLMGVQVPSEEKAEFESRLQATGYSYWEETNNLAYKYFLS